MAITKKDIRQSAIINKRLGLQAQYTARPVAYQLLEIANSDIGAAGAYWYEYDRNNGSQPFEWMPNDIRDRFSSKVAAVFEQRVDGAHMLRLEQRQAAEIFRGFYRRAADVEWNERQAFEELDKLYDRAKNSMLAVLKEANRRTYDLQARRMALMGRKGLPYRKAAM